MADVELAIKIPEELFSEIDDENYQSVISWYDTTLYRAIKDGTVLPKGHGRLIDADELEELFGEECVGDCGACMPKRKTDGKGRWYDTCSLIDKAPTIIESDKEDKYDR